MKIEKPEIITEAYYIVRDPLFVCVVVDAFSISHKKKTSAIPCGQGVSHLHICSHPPPHEKKINYSKVFAHHKKDGDLSNNNQKKHVRKTRFAFVEQSTIYL